MAAILSNIMALPTTPVESYTSIAATMSVLADTITFDDPTIATKYGIKDMRFNRVVLRGGLRVKKVQAPGPTGNLAGPYPVALPTIGPIDSGLAPANTDSAGYTTITGIIAGTVGTDITLPGDTNYIIDQAIQMPTGKNLQAADGTTVYFTRAASYNGNLIEATSCVGSSISNIRFEGKVDDGTHSAAEADSNACAIRIFGGSGITIQHCKFYRDPSYALYVYSHSLPIIQYNDFEDSWAGVLVDGNNLSDSGLVQGNRIVNTSTYKSWQGVTAHNTSNFRVFHNIIGGQGLRAPTVHGADGTYGISINIYASNAYVVENNSCTTPYWASFVSGAAGINGFVRHNYFLGGYGALPNTTLRGYSSWITGVGADNISMDLNFCDGAIMVGDTGGGDHCSLTNNAINAWGVGIDVRDFALNCLIQANNISRLGGSNNGILLFNKNTAAVNCRVLGNNIVGFSTGISITNTGGTGTVFGLTVTGNVFFGCTTDISVPVAIIVHASCTIQGYQASTPPAPSPAPAPSPPPSSPTESTSGSTIPSFTVLYDAALGAWTVAGGVIFLNGVAAGFSQNVTLLLYFNHTIYQQNQAGGWWSWTNNNWLSTTDPRPAAGSSPPVPVPNITTARHIKDLLQVGNAATGCYFVEDNRWGASTITEGTTSSTYAQSVERSLQLGSAGEIAWRMQVRWPDFINGVSTDPTINGTYPEVKCYPAAQYGAKPGNYGPDRWPAWDFALRLPDGQVVAPPAGTPGPIAANWQSAGGSVSNVIPCGSTPGSNLPKSLAILTSGSVTVSGRFAYSMTGKGHLSFDCWLQDPSQPAQQFGFFASPITHEIMVPLRNVGAYGRHPNGRNPGWYDHDVTFNGILYHVYCAKNTGGAGLRYNFGGLNGAYPDEETGGGRTGWKFIIFQHDGDAHPLDSNGKFNIPLSQMLNHLKVCFDSRGIAFVRGTEHLVDVELGIEQVYGQDDITVYDYKVNVA